MQEVTYVGKWRQQIKNNRWKKKTEKKNCIEAGKNKKKKIVRKKNLTEFELS